MAAEDRAPAQHLIFLAAAGKRVPAAGCSRLCAAPKRERRLFRASGSPKGPTRTSST